VVLLVLLDPSVDLLDVKQENEEREMEEEEEIQYLLLVVKEEVLDDFSTEYHEQDPLNAIVLVVYMHAQCQDDAHVFSMQLIYLLVSSAS